MINNLRKNKGITLIALVITIIVLLILAGVTINAIVGNESAMEKAKEAREKTYEAQEKEQIILNQINSQFEPEWDGTVANSFARGTGSESDPYIIENGSQLAYLAAAVNGEKDPPTGTTVTFEGKFISIVKSINLGNKEFTPISYGGNSERDSNAAVYTTGRIFQGTLNGNNNVIIGLKIGNGDMKQRQGVGLVGVLGENGTVKNIVIYEGEIKAACLVGGIVGAAKGTVDNCQNNANVIAVESNGDSGTLAGGIVGYTNGGVKIINCKNTGTVKAEVSGYVGGILGICETGVVEITNCNNSGTIIANKQQAGGIIGYQTGGDISHCYNTGNVEAKSVGARGIVGGIVGSFKGGTISDVYNAGNVTIKKSNVENTVSTGGGIIGFYAAGSIEKAYNKGEILGDGESKGGVVGQKTGGTLSKTYFYKSSGSELNGIGTTTSGSTTPLTPIAETSEQFESTTAIYNSLDEFLKAIR